ncbi:MAG: hypothetical protein IID44_19255 [Planctomycetes bacterium]|nr:hypothetical protein [Planctomycetota bacterium]
MKSARHSKSYLLSLVVFATLTTAAPAAEKIEAVAFSGEPFGVGKITVQFDRYEYLAPDQPLRLVDADGRVLYPAFTTTTERVPTQPRSHNLSTVTGYFLFRGADSLKLNLQTERSHRVKIKSTADAKKHQTLLDEWWRHYTSSARSITRSDAYQPMVENYLVQTLGRRLKLEAPRLSVRFSGYDWADEVFAVMSGAESVRIAAQRDVLLQDTLKSEAADQPLPRPVATPPVRLPEVKGKVVIEPIAMHVPLECFYIRCGSFKNFLWLKETIDDWGTQIRHLTSVRGVDYEIGPRLEHQLGLKQTTVAKLFGDTVISDVAIVGTDTFLREGAAIGIIFEAKSSTVLRLQIMRQREEAKKANPAATSEMIELAGSKVSAITTPDNSIRSFYAVDGKYHFVTTSKTLARRFLEAGQGKDSLGASKEFRFGRSIMPLADDHVAYVYLSDPFFRNIISPHYRIEMTRRMQAASEMDVVRLARLAAKAEGEAAKTIKELIALDLLPKSFGGRPDGSRVLLAGGVVTDSLRGAYGSLLPVPDVKIAAATPSEALSYRRFAAIYSGDWQRMDPVIIGVKRSPLAADAEGRKRQRITFDVHITPYARQHYGQLAQWLPKADSLRWENVPGDVASFQLNLMGRKFSAGIGDFVPLAVISDGRVVYQEPDEKDIPAYLATDRRQMPDPDKSSIDFGYLLDGKTPDDDGDIRMKDSLFGSYWARRLTDFDVVAPSKSTLARVAPNLRIVSAERPAKARLRIEDLRGKKIASLIKAESYIRARRVSAGNTQFMHTLSQQLHVPVADAQTVAEELLGAKLACPLGGEYQIESGFSGNDRWQSTAWQADSLYAERRVPKDYTAPLLDWFAGLSLEFNIDATTLTTHIELDVRPKK